MPSKNGGTPSDKMNAGKPEKPKFPKRMTRVEKYRRTVIVYAIVPVVILVAAFFARPADKSVAPADKPKSKDKIPGKMPKSGLKEESGDPYEKLWTPNQKEFTSFVSDTKRDISNGVLAVVFQQDCGYCKKLGKQLGKAMNVKNEIEVYKDVRTVGLDVDNLDSDFKTKWKIERYPSIYLFTDKDTAIEYDYVATLREPVKRIAHWLNKLEFSKKEAANYSYPKMSGDEARKLARKKGTPMNNMANAQVLFSVSPKLAEVLPEAEGIDAWKQHIVIDSENTSMDHVADLEKPEEKSTSEYFFTRYVAQQSTMVPLAIADEPLTKTFSDKDAAKTQVAQVMKQMQIPIFSRLFPEAMEEHVRAASVMVVANQPVGNDEVLVNFKNFYTKFQHQIQFLYMYPADAPDMAARWFGFDQRVRGMQVSMYSPKNGFARFTQNLSDSPAVEQWLIDTLTKWNNGGTSNGDDDDLDLDEEDEEEGEGDLEDDDEEDLADGEDELDKATEEKKED